jgi:uncharacterized protein YgiM (DUF1202 family)
MGRVKDGIKLGIGLWLFFKVILPLVGLALVVIVIAVALAAAPDIDVDDAVSESTTTTTATTVTYRVNCNVRVKPRRGARRVGFARAGKSYRVLVKRGKWRKLQLASRTGWAGCLDTLD